MVTPGQCLSDHFPPQQVDPDGLLYYIICNTFSASHQIHKNKPVYQTVSSYVNLKSVYRFSNHDNQPLQRDSTHPLLARQVKTNELAAKIPLASGYISSRDLMPRDMSSQRQFKDPPPPLPVLIVVKEDVTKNDIGRMNI